MLVLVVGETVRVLLVVLVVPVVVVVSKVGLGEIVTVDEDSEVRVVAEMLVLTSRGVIAGSVRVNVLV